MYQIIERRWDPGLKTEYVVLHYECEDPKEARFIEQEIRKTIRKDDLGWYHEGGRVEVFIREKEKTPGGGSDPGANNRSINASAL